MKIIKYRVFLLGLMLLCVGCEKKPDEKSMLPERNLSQNFKNYWFSGQAEITSYKLDQNRYGESRAGTAVLIFVTEDFLPESQVKANSANQSNIPVLKLNATKNFITGMYPYSIMQSTFLPLEGNSHALKITASIQEWCGQVYMQLNNRSDFEIKSHSYFEGEADHQLNLDKTYLENELWSLLRIDPEKAPTGTIQMIPSFEHIRLDHTEIRPYQAIAEFYQDEELSVYKITYPELNRELKIYYHNSFPFGIEKWEETTEKDGKEYVTTATKMTTIKSAYWTKNSNKHLHLRDTLNLN